MIDLAAVAQKVFAMIWWWFPLIFIVVLLRTRWFKGIAGEAAVRLVARFRLNPNEYHAFHNVTLPTEDGTTQIDHIYVSRFGVFVIETKNMRGWIFGRANQATWTQKIYRKSYKFQNPLRQNYKHVKTLETLLEIPASAIHSVIAFVGECELKTEMPANVTRGSGYIRYIRSIGDDVLTDEQVEAICVAIDSGRLAETWETHRQHVQNLRDRHGDSWP